MVWFRRLLPILIIAAAWFGFQAWERRSARQETREEQRLALLTARVWLATATYRHDSTGFLAYRDSLLEANRVSKEELYEYLDRYQNRPEDYLPFSLRVSKYVDSLAKIQDSILKIAPDSTAGVILK